MTEFEDQGVSLTAVAVAAGVRPEVAGKPHAPMVALARGRAGNGPLTVVGDRPSTDGGFARALGARFALVLSGLYTGPLTLFPLTRLSSSLFPTSLSKNPTSTPSPSSGTALILPPNPESSKILKAKKYAGATINIVRV